MAFTRRTHELRSYTNKIVSYQLDSWSIQMQSPTTTFIKTTLNELQITDNLPWLGNNHAFIQDLGTRPKSITSFKIVWHQTTLNQYIQTSWTGI